MLNRSTGRSLLKILVFLLATTPLAWAPSTVCKAELPSDLLGTWQAKGEERVLRLEPERVVESEGGRLKVRGVVCYEPGKLVLRAGLLETWTVNATGNTLHVSRGDKALEYQRLDTVPAALELTPLALGAPKQLPAERIEAIQKDLAARREADQKVRSDPARLAQLAEVDLDNTRFLRDLVQEVGWIDVARFGPRASVDAFLLVQHSQDLPLMLAALPFIEEDARRHKEYAQPFTLLFDRVQIDLGRKQRYGTQLRKDAEGNPMVLPLEEPEKVDERLKELGLPPLSEYLATASKYLFDGREVRMPREGE